MWVVICMRRTEILSSNIQISILFAYLSTIILFPDCFVCLRSFPLNYA